MTAIPNDPSASIPKLVGIEPERTEALLSVRDIVQEFAVTTAKGRRRLQAVAGVSLEIYPGETLALVGESGCGKSSLARAIVQAPRPRSGSVSFKGQDLTRLRGAALQHALRGLQLIFQDPFSSLDPRWKIADIVAEPLIVNRVGTRDERQERVNELLEAVGLDPAIGSRRPRGLSGGQCQRVAIARALALHPDLLICDEAVSSLDVSVQAQILNIFEQLREERGLAYLFITHDLAVARHVSDRVAVMYLGKVCEIGLADEIYERTMHPYASALLAAIPDPDSNRDGRERLQVAGDLPSAADPPSGCRFRTRCPLATERCAQEEPQLLKVSPTRSVACHFPLTPGSARSNGATTQASHAPER